MHTYPPDLDSNNWLNTQVWINTPDGTLCGTVVHQTSADVLSIWTGDIMLTALAGCLKLENAVYTITPDWD